MALRKCEIAMRFLYTLKLWTDRKSIVLEKIPGAPGAYIVTASIKAVGIATRKKRTNSRVGWGRNDRQIPVGTILVSCWLHIRSSKTIALFEELARKTGIPNQWIFKGDERYLYVFLFVDDLFHFARMQQHIIGSSQEGYIKEETLLEMAITELEEQQYSFPENPATIEKQVLAQALARIHILFQFCYDHDKNFAKGKAIILGARISNVKSMLESVMPEIGKMVGAIRRRQDSIHAISPVIASRHMAIEKMIKQYISVIKSAIKMLNTYLTQFENDKLTQSPQTIRQALTSQASRLEQTILCRPARRSAQHACARMKRASESLGSNDTSTTITELRRARTLLQQSLEIMCITK